MKHFASKEFWKCFDKLPATVQELAKKNHELLKNNPKHPSLHFKKVGDFYSIRIGLRYRALGVGVSKGIVWFWIGNLGDYDKLLGK